jgi:hypothetical protein
MVEERRNHLLPPLRRLLKILHPEAIPWPGAFVYSALSGYALLYDLVSDTPAADLSRAKREFGKLRIFLLWLHAFEEPFYSKNNFERLALSSHLKSVGTWFVCVMNCMVLRKETD